MAAAGEDKCPAHPGKLVDMFCGDHDVVCCSECVKAFHKACKSITYVSEAAKGIADSKEYTDTLGNATNVKGLLQGLVDRRNKDLVRLEKERDTALKSVEDVRASLNVLLDILESNSKEEIRKRFSKETAAVKDDVQKINAIVSSLNGFVNNLETKVGGRPRIFANVKGAKLAISGTDRLKSVVEMKIGEERIEFKPDNHNINGFKKLTSLGTVRYLPRIYKCSRIGEHDIGTRKDAQTCHVAGVVKLETGQTVVADWNNKSIKLFDSFFTLTELLSLSSEPSDICCVAPREVAVALLYKKKVQIVSVEAKLRVVKEIYIDGHCRGLAFHDGQLYVACWLNENDNPRILVYSMSGSKLRTIEKTQRGHSMFSELSRLAVSADGTRLFVTDSNKGVIVLDRAGEVVAVVTHRDWKYPVGVCTDDTGQAFVCYKFSQVIAQVGPNAESMGVVAGQDDGIDKPMAIFYDVANYRITVAHFESNWLQSFNLSFYK